MASVMSSQYPVMSSSHLSAGGNSNSFRVKNIDDKGRIIHVGFLEILPGEIVFRYEHHPHHEAKWPLHTIRKYGINLESNVFAFEAGRKAPGGEGAFAFRTEGVQACEIRQRLDYFTHSS
uniref:IRS-type PTB domain-containing protein n=1 Tax=Amphimedon queenslandica TaxID=400682 RepID=A0A1X7VB21_AMPQE